MNTTDRELLELAAKAAGIHGEYYSGFLNEEWVDGIVYVLDDGQQCIWNPLLDNGDALRLAVRLDISFRMDYSYPEGVRTVEVGVTLGNFLYADSVPTGNDPYAATRRAIVRAAAEIWKEKK